MTITFIGLGAMGRPMAANLSRRFPTRVWNRTSAIATRHASDAMLAANLLAASECLFTLDRFGIDLRKAFEVLSGGSGRSFASTDLLPSRLIDGNWPVTFKLALHEKDVPIARSIAGSLGVESPLIEATARQMKDALADLGPEADYVEAAGYVAHLNRMEWN